MSKDKRDRDSCTQEKKEIKEANRKADAYKEPKNHDNAAAHLKNVKAASAASAARKGPALEKGIKVAPEVLSYIEKCESMQVARDPYYQHMPKDSATAAVKYASKMGGESHESSDCLIM